MGELAMIIIAAAFAVLVIFLVVFIVKSLKLLEETQSTIVSLREESLSTLTSLKSEVNVTLYHTNEILAKTSVLVDDINGKMEIVEPLFVAVADLSESVSDLNSSARDLTTRAGKASKSTFRAGAGLSILSLFTKLFRK